MLSSAVHLPCRLVSLAETAGQVEPKWVVSFSRNAWSGSPETAGQIRPKYALLVSTGVAVDPNLATFSFLHHRAGELLPTLAAVADHLPTDVRRSLRSSDMDIPDDATAAQGVRPFSPSVVIGPP